MTSNVACSTQGCTNPVVGQCGCGKFYCSTHAAGKLCGHCAAVEDYWRMAQHVDGLKVDLVKINGRFGDQISSLIASILLLGITGLLIISTFMFLGGDNTGSRVLGLIGIILVAISGVGIYSKIKAAEAKEIQRIEATRPNFGEFYKAYKKHKSDEESERHKKLLLGAFIVASAMHQAHKQNQAYDDLHTIRKRLE